jgi:hypothetical protein
MTGILEVLKKYDLLGKKGSQASKIDRLSLSKMVDIATEVENAVKEEQVQANNPICSHSASLHLGGDSIECSDLDCRIFRINKLARFALMYSDKVYITSFFSKYKKLESKDNLPKSKERFYDDLIVINEMRPLIQKGFIGLFAPETDTCFACQAEEFLGEGARRRFKTQYNKLEKTYLEKIQVTGRKVGSEYVWVCKGPLQYFDHCTVKVQDVKNHPILTRKPRIMDRLEKGGTIAVSKSLVKELKLHRDKAHVVAANAIYGLASSKCLNTGFLTEKDLHISFLNSLHEFPMVQQQNAIAAKYLASIVPFIEDVNLTDIIKVRNREEEAFINYRHALSSAIGEFVKPGEQFTIKEARALHADIIAPSLASLNIRVKQAKKDLVRKPLRSLAGVVGSISFGMLTGLIKPDVAAIATAIGLVAFGRKFIGDVMALGDGEDKVANEHLYFLWKIKKKARK